MAGTVETLSSEHPSALDRITDDVEAEALRAMYDLCLSGYLRDLVNAGIFTSDDAERIVGMLGLA